MEKQQAIEWKELQRQAIVILRQGYTESPKAERIFQMLRLPSFENPDALGIYQKKSVEGETFFAAKMQWQRGSDIQKFQTPLERMKHPVNILPSIATQVAGLTNDAVASILGQFQSIQVPIWVDRHGFGIDGTSYELIIGRSYSSVNFSWWESPPPEWESMAEMVKRVVHRMELAFAQQHRSGA